MAQQVINQQEDTRVMDLGIYVTGSEQSASWGCSLITGKGNIKIMHGTASGKNSAALEAIVSMLKENIKARKLAIGINTNSKWLIDELTTGYKAKTAVERVAAYGQPTMNLFNEMIKLLKGLEDKLEIRENAFASELAKTAAYYELHQQKAAKEAAAIASSEEELEGEALEA